MCFDFTENTFSENIPGRHVSTTFVVFTQEMKYDASLHNLIKIV